MKNKKNIGIVILISALFLGLMIWAVSNKVNYFVDDILSYSLANSISDFLFNLKAGVRFERAEFSKAFMDYLSVSAGNRSNLTLVWQNQANDVHPPLFYLFLHIISAIKINTFSKWYAASINIVSMLLILFVSRKMVKLFTTNDTINNLVSLGIALCYSFSSLATLLRMYCLMMFFVTLITYIFLYYVDKKIDWKFYVSSYVVTVLGALTHYYFIVYIVLLSVVFGVYLLATKRYKETGLFCLTMALAGGSSYLIFPAMIYHLLGTGVGSNTLENARDFSTFLGNIVLFINILSKELFGGLLPLILLGIIVLFVVCLKSNKIKLENKNRYIVAYSSIVLFFLFVSKATILETERYLSPMFAITFIVVMTTLLILLSKVINNKKIYSVVCVLFVVMMSALGYKNAPWPYLYKDSQVLIDFENSHKDTDCIVVVGEQTFEFENNMFNMLEYQSITVLDMDDFYAYDINELIKSKDAVIVLINSEDENEIINSLNSRLTSLKYNKSIGQFTRATYYYYD